VAHNNRFPGPSLRAQGFQSLACLSFELSPDEVFTFPVCSDQLPASRRACHSPIGELRRLTRRPTRRCCGFALRLGAALGFLGRRSRRAAVARQKPDRGAPRFAPGKGLLFSPCADGNEDNLYPRPPAQPRLNGDRVAGAQSPVKRPPPNPQRVSANAYLNAPHQPAAPSGTA